MKPFFKKIKSKGTKTITNTSGKDIISLLKMNKREQGPFEVKFRRELYKIINSPEIKDIFTLVLLNLFLSRKTTSQNTDQIVHIKDICNLLWKEFIDIYQKEGLEEAISTIFTRYES